MSAIHHFEITPEGELKKYTGTGGRVLIPAVVRSIGRHAFFCFEGLTAVEIPAGVTSIGNNAFSMCNRLKTLVIPSGVRSIGDCAFFACTALTEITLPGSLATIHEFAFYGCRALEKIWVDGTEADVERIRGLLHAAWGKVVRSWSADRGSWLGVSCAVAIGAAGSDKVPVVSDGVAAGAGEPTVSAQVLTNPEVAEPVTAPAPRPLLATVLSDVRVCIPPSALPGAENNSHQVLSEYAGMVASFL